MPLTVRTEQWSPYTAAYQSQAASEQTTLAWTQGGWRQQLEDGSCWMRVDEINPNEPRIAETNEAFTYRLNELSTSAASIGRRAQQNAHDAACDQADGRMAVWQASKYDVPNTPGGSPIFSDGAGQESTMLPMFLGPFDLHIPEPSSATSLSFLPDLHTQAYQFKTVAEPFSRRTSLERSPSSEQTGVAVDIQEVVKPKPKRGRPRLPQNKPHVCDDIPCKHVIDNSGSRRVPHNQVEQKYRNGLNAEFERLREAVAAAPSRAFAHLSNSPAKPSKAMVLASAIDYIKSIEAERDQLAEENQVLRGRKKRLRRDKKVAGNE